MTEQQERDVLKRLEEGQLIGFIAPALGLTIGKVWKHKRLNPNFNTAYEKANRKCKRIRSTHQHHVNDFFDMLNAK